MNTMNFDRRSRTRCKLPETRCYIWKDGRVVDIPVIEASDSGARVIIPDSMAGKGAEILLIHVYEGVEFRAEYRIAWSRELIGRKVVAGLQCLLTTSTQAA